MSGEAEGGIGSCCTLICISIWEPFCNTKRYGCERCKCGGPRGFCHSCFNSGFDEDAWDKEDAQRNPATVTSSVREQPGLVDNMTIISPATQTTMHPGPNTDTERLENMEGEKPNGN